MARVVAAGRARGIPVLVDPKIPAHRLLRRHDRSSRRTTTRRRSRRTCASGRTTTPWPPRAPSAQRAGCERVLITRGEHGMCLLDGETRRALPGRRARGVRRDRRRRHGHRHARARPSAARRVDLRDACGHRPTTRPASSVAQVRPGHGDRRTELASRPSSGQAAEVAASNRRSRASALQARSGEPATAVQCLKCRRPVNTIARPCSSAAAITSASRTDPPG